MHSHTHRSRMERLRLSNESDIDITLHVEPWGAEIPMPAGGKLEVEFKGPEGDCMEISYYVDRIILWGWSGSTFGVFQNGHRIGNFEDLPPVPPLPVPPRSLR